MTTLIAIIIIAIIITAALLLLKSKGKAISYPYAPKPIMTEAEQILYHRLKEALPEKIILAQIQMSSFLRVTASQGRQAALNRILMKSADFVIAEKDTTVIAAIELQDASHKASNRTKNDEFKRAALEAAKIPLIEFQARKMPTAEEIRQAIKGVRS